MPYLFDSRDAWLLNSDGSYRVAGRNGASAQLMKLVVANLTKDDIVAIAAYVSSRTPPAPASSNSRVARLDNR